MESDTLFGLAYFRAYAKQLMQINMPLCIIIIIFLTKPLCIIYKPVNVVYEKTIYEGTIFVSENL